MRQPKITPASKTSEVGTYFSLLIGLFLALALLKWGNPVILDSQIEAPTGFFEYFFQAWPVKWAYVLLLPVVVFGLFSAFSCRKPSAKVPQASRSWLIKLIPFLPLLWLLCLLASASQTVRPVLTQVTMPHLFTCVVFFYLGFWGLREEIRPWALCAMLTLGLLWVIKLGVEQHFGGLAQTLQMLKQQPGWENTPREIVEKFEKGRIFSTLCYPNSLAGALLLLLPISLATIWSLGERFSRPIQILLVTAFGASGLACLYWSNSKAGWLVAIVVAVTALWVIPYGGRCKRWVILAMLVLGLSGFFVKYADFFKKGATSVVARFDYWKAAVQSTAEHPLLGSGPGTFAVQYAKFKAPESEFARLCHNDYLEQASDSGIPSFLIFCTFIIGSLIWFYRLGFVEDGRFNLYKLAIWLGLLGVALHSCAEFHLYIPALAWTEFLFLGWLWGRTKARP